MAPKVRTAGAIIVAALLTPAIATAHSPYERTVGVVQGTSGQRFILVARYTDGIIMPDPVSLAIRDGAGQTVTESAVHDMIEVWCTSASTCLAFAYDAQRSEFLPSNIWRLSGPDFLPVARTPFWQLRGAALHVWRHWLGYLAALASALIPLAAIMRTLRIKHRTVRAVLTVLLVLGSLAWWFFWWFFVSLSYLSLLLILAFAGGVLIASYFKDSAWLRKGLATT